MCIGGHLPRRFRPGIAISALLVLPLMSASALGTDLFVVGASIPDAMRLDPQASQLATRFTSSEGNPQNTDSLYKFGFKFNAVDAAQPVSGALQGFSVARRNWEQNNVEDLRLNFSALGDWVQLSVRQSQSQYSADQNYLRELASRNKNKNLLGKERFLGRDGAEGAAGLQRLDVRLFDSNLLGVSTFAFRSEVDPYYESLTSSKSKDEFATANRSSDAAGAKVRFASLSITTSYMNSSQLIGFATPSEARHDQTIGLDLTDLRGRIGESLPPVIWMVAPSGIYATNFVKETSYKTAAEGLPDRTTGIGAGAYWTWDNGNAHVSYWKYDLDSRRVGAASYDSAGRGLDASIGVYKGPVSFYGGVSLRHMEDLAPQSQAIDHSYDAYASLSYKPAYLPDIVVDGGLGRYGYDSRAYGITSDATYWSATLGLEFAKFLWPNESQQRSGPKGINSRSLSLKLFYKYYNEADHGIVGATLGDSHLLGMAFRAALR